MIIFFFSFFRSRVCAKRCSVVLLAMSDWAWPLFCHRVCSANRRRLAASCCCAVCANREWFWLFVPKFKHFLLLKVRFQGDIFEFALNITFGLVEDVLCENKKKNNNKILMENDCLIFRIPLHYYDDCFDNLSHLFNQNYC